MESPPRLRPGTSPQALQIPPHGGHPALRLSLDSSADLGFPLACLRRFRLRARLGVALSPCPGQRGVTPAFGYGAPYPGASGTSTHLIWALPSTHYEPLRLPGRPATISDSPYTPPLAALTCHRRGSPALGPINFQHMPPLLRRKTRWALSLSPPTANGLPRLSNGSASSLCLRGYL